MSRERDDTTRYLCAAAHLDDRFTDRVIREFLTEPTRAVPPVAGVRAEAVLAEAVAARARRKFRDTLVITLFAGVLAAEGRYERVTAAMDSLRDAADLSPRGRFADLRVSEQVVVAADELIDNMDRAGDFLAGPPAAPYPLLRGQRVRELRATDVRNYFQLADQGRYLKVLESRLTRTLVEALTEAGYDVAALEQQAATVANSSVYLSGGSRTGAPGQAAATAPAGAVS